MRNFVRFVLSLSDILTFYRKTFVTITVCVVVGVTLPYLLSGRFGVRHNFVRVMRFVLATLYLPPWFG